MNMFTASPRAPKNQRDSRSSIHIKPALAILLALVGLNASGLSLAEAASGKAPKWSFLRWDEDWSQYQNNDLKHVKLSDDGSNWASFGGHVRYRGESWNNLGFNPNNDDVFHLFRATAHGDFHFGDQARVFVELKTANASERDLPGGRRPLDVDTFALQQAFLDYQFSDSLRLRVGRQALSFAKQRLVSPLPWGNALRTWDGVRLDYQGSDWQSTVFASQFVPVRLYERNKANKAQQFNGIHLAAKKASDLGGSSLKPQFYLYHLSNDAEQDLFSFGSVVDWKSGPWHLNLEATLQTGDSASGRDVSASMLGSELSYGVKNSAVKKVFVGFDFGSGDASASDNDDETFHQLFPLGHAYLGFADHIGRRNIVAGNVGFIAKPGGKNTLRVAAHSFYKHKEGDAIYNAGGGVLRPAAASGNKDHIANELDVSFIYPHNKHLKFLFGLTYVDPGEAIKASGVEDEVFFAYWQANYMF